MIFDHTNTQIRAFLTHAARTGIVLTPADRRVLRTIEENAARTERVLRAIHSLCVERGIYSEAQLRERLGAQVSEG